MANGDPLRVGLTQPPDNRATSATLLVHTGSAFGTQHTAFWVHRLGAPICTAAVRGDNFSTPRTTGVTPAGVLGMIQPQSAGIGVLGTAAGGPNLFFGETGVMGVTNSFGVVGRSLTGLIVDEPGSFVSGTGVVGQCDAGVGVHGIATSGWGIIGQSSGRAGVTGKSVTGVGVEARSEQSHGVRATTKSGIGVAGESVANDGVSGRSRDAIGVSGFTEQGIAGIWGRSDQFGVVGVSEQGVGVAGATISGRAGYFRGDVEVRGNFYVSGAKSAVVQHPDGSQRALFCLESPESYFEDFGEVTLTGASLVVRLDPDFAALVKRNKYQVFLTSYGPEALYVRKRGAEAFEIARVDGGAGGKRRKVRVGYRIVARRADMKPERLPKVKSPVQAAELTQPGLASGKPRRKRGDRFAPLAQLEPLPATPKIPSPDLKAMAEAKPDEAKGKGTDASNA